MAPEESRIDHEVAVDVAVAGVDAVAAAEVEMALIGTLKILL